MSNHTIWRDIRQTFQYKDKMVTQLIIVNAAVFAVIGIIRLVFYVSGSPLGDYYYSQYLAVPSSLHDLVRSPWTLITYMFTHGELLHIALNMLWLYWFGKIMTEFLGGKKILPLYLLGGLSGAILFVISYQLFPAFQYDVADSRLWGASASVLAIVTGTATLVPDYTLFLMFIGPVKIKWIALVVVIIDLVSIPVENAGGNIAHIGGAAFGYFFIRQLQKGNDLSSGLTRFFDFTVTLFQKKSGHVRKISRKVNKTTAEQMTRQERLDRILDKIAKGGYERLSKEEKEFLFMYSKENN